VRLVIPHLMRNPIFWALLDSCFRRNDTRHLICDIADDLQDGLFAELDSRAVSQ
jgi:hypothetical protein